MGGAVGGALGDAVGGFSGRCSRSVQCSTVTNQ